MLPYIGHSPTKEIFAGVFLLSDSMVEIIIVTVREFLQVSLPTVNLVYRIDCTGAFLLYDSIVEIIIVILCEFLHDPMEGMHSMAALTRTLSSHVKWGPGILE